jgi:hypothetical protein
MTAAGAGMLLILFLPFVLSLLGKAAMPKMLCLVASALALLLSVEPYGAALPWVVGMAVAVISVCERFRRRAV